MVGREPHIRAWLHSGRGGSIPFLGLLESSDLVAVGASAPWRVRSLRGDLPAQRLERTCANASPERSRSPGPALASFAQALSSALIPQGEPSPLMEALTERRGVPGCAVLIGATISRSQSGASAGSSSQTTSYFLPPRADGGKTIAPPSPLHSMPFGRPLIGQPTKGPGVQRNRRCRPPLGVTCTRVVVAGRLTSSARHAAMPS